MMADIIPVATGERWIGYGVRSFQSVIHDLISMASEELVMTVYILTNMDIVNDIKNALERGVGVEIYLYSEEAQEENEAVRSIMQLKNEYRYLRIYWIENKMLHAKVLVADGSKVVSGSANFTTGGMVKNYELGFLVNNPTIALQILTLIKRLNTQ
ncbi:MAG TPA: phospholipase D family protein [Candidatus Methanoperedens sp.]